uniref:non-ribosomal peptide synthetase n=1 Tax=Aldersonia kunmingensis TaxID=408066 RepID=UPI0012ED9638
MSELEPKATSRRGEGRRERRGARPQRRRAAAPMLPQLLSAAVDLGGDNPALIFTDRVLTYRELDAQSSRLARVLIAEGVGPGDVVALGVRRSIESVLSVWAVAKTGAAFVPVDPNYPVERIEHMVTDSGARLGLTVTSDSTGLPDAVSWLVIDGQELIARLDGIPDHPVSYADRVRPLRVEDAAYIIYTSGSTGLPKGVVVTHSGLANLAVEQRERFGIDTDSRTLHFATPSFDASVLELLLAVGGGATMIICPPNVAGGAELATLLVDEGVTHAFVTPSALASVDPDNLPELRAVMSGGEAVPAELVARWTGDGTREFFNMYGPTEATVASHISDALTSTGRVTIGVPIRGTQALVLDARMRPVPAGAAGELYLSGALLARGYHQRAGLTAERFVANPLGQPGERMYRTGDLVRRDASGEFEYLGRNDFQVKVRGFRIELGEIDSTLSSHDSVEFAATIGHKMSTGATVLVSYVVPAHGGVDTAELVEHAGSVLPAHMVPSSIMVIDQIPLTPAGKLDRNALPAPIFGETIEYREPRTALEKTIADVFAETLGLERVGIDDSFFALGGDSIISIQLVARAKARGVLFTPRDVFDRRTVAALAEIAQLADEAEGAVVVLDELPGGGVGDMPLLPVVQFMLARGGGYGRFNQTITLELPEGIDRAGVVATLSALVERHDMLRSSLGRNADGEWQLQVDPAGRADVGKLVHHVPFDAELDEPSLTAIASAELDTALGRFDLAKGIVAQFVWLDPGQDSGRTGRLIVALHHLVVDGVSWRIIIPDLITAWAQVSSGAPADLPEVGTSMRRWATGLVDEAQRPERVAELPFWRKVIEGADPVLGRRQLDATVDVAATIDAVRVELTPEATDALLTRVPQAFHGGVNDALLAALALAVARWRARRGVDEASALIRLEGHGREEDVVPGADLSRTVGWFTTMYPVRLNLAGIDLDDAFAGGAGIGSAVKAVKEQLLAVPDRGIGYGMLRYLNDETAAQLPVGPVGQISFNYLGRISAADLPQGMDKLGWIPASDLGEVSAGEDRDMAAMAAVDINAIVVGGALSARFAFPTGVLTTAEVDELAALWVSALDAVVRYVGTAGAGGRTPSDLPLVSVGQSDIERWESRFPHLVDVWPLAPLQSGLMFHAIMATADVDVYIVQVSMDLEGGVDPAGLRIAARAVLNRYPNLRTAFVTDDAGGGVQVVLDSVEIPWAEVDLTESDDQDAVVARFLAEDRARNFDLAAPPLIRFNLLRLGADRYRLVVTNHHILLDGWSMPLLLKDMLTLYATRGDGSVLPPVRSYRAFLEWVVQRDTAESLEVWSHALAGVEEPSLLAPDAEVESTAVAVEYSVELDEATTSTLSSFAAGIGVTVNTVAQAVWGILLGRLLGRTDVVFGTTVSGRPPELADIESMVGLFINTLPVRVKYDPAESVSELLVRLQGEQADLLAHHFVGLADILATAGPGAEFDTLMVYESYPIDAAGISSADALLGMSITDIDMANVTHYPLSVLAITGARLEFKFQYLPHLFDADRIATLADRFLRTLHAVLADPRTPTGDIDILAATERDDLVSRIGPGGVPAGKVFADLLAEAVALNPGGTAVVFEDRQLSYRELDDASNRLARLLIDRGIGADDLVAVGIRRSLESVVATWAVAKTGAACVPMDPTYPAERIMHMITDSGALLGLTVSSARAGLPDAVQWLEMDELDDSGQLDALATTPIDARDRIRPVRPANPAYMIYTSGSTGLPKGVVVTHAGLPNYTVEQRERYRVTAESRVLHFASPSFDASMLELLLAIGAGATLVVCPPEIYGGDELAALLATQRVTHAFITPAALASVPVDGLDALRVLVAGGEAVPAELVRRWAPGRELFNGYGPTETTIMTNISRPLSVDDRVVIGGPIRGMQSVVLDERLHPAPVGVSGELYSAGTQLARGYHDRPALTAARFVANPFGAPGERMYRTGDVVRWTESDDVEYVGRSDFQVKVRGFRIELGEIDAVLTSHESVDFAVTVGHTGAVGAVALVSYVVVAQGQAIDVDALIEFAARALPAHMVPASIMVLDAVPLTPVGKLDRDALPEPHFAARSLRAPSTALEETIAEVMAEVLGLDRVGVDDSFFALGGDSIVSIQLVSRAKARGVLFRPRDVFERKTVAALAEIARSADEGGAPERLAELPGGGI